ncbi:hypothetical protein HMPREF0063_13013 [Aeromicrobium marinum DSM 15272]|uniref:MmcQ/YjbR family DNA-binding protein n=1 Tax=Aeromicrobium marinum DSM 15272 TaxID=585531 RepID=E2SG54_9ACTN|nr:MmcQ/YjbR family DNA-binding protein [Aeromicrobium marinum]EFQ81811.1 hypothetical protein HMPREF0063_13013 [Aeromicrobium marinum DSM 15272]
MASSWDAVVAFATSTFPDTTESVTYASPSIKVKGKLVARLRREADAPGALALRCSSSDKEALVSGADPAFFTTPHYDGYDYVLVDLDRVDPRELLELVTEAWLLVAPVRVRQAWEAQGA